MVEIRFKYQQEANSTEVTFQYRIELVDIIEYVENGTEIGYQIGEEIETYNIGGTGWNDISYVIEPVVSINGTDDVHVMMNVGN